MEARFLFWLLSRDVHGFAARFEEARLRHVAHRPGDADAAPRRTRGADRGARCLMRRYPPNPIVVKIFISSGEVSGDLAGAQLATEPVAAIRRRASRAWAAFRMEQAGVEIDDHTNHLGTVGISEAFGAIPSLSRMFLKVRRRILDKPPDVAVLIGNDIFNVLLGRWLKSKGIPTIAHFPPQVWVWRVFAGPIARSFDLILASFPDEQRVYRAPGHRRRSGSSATISPTRCSRPPGGADRLAAAAASTRPVRSIGFLARQPRSRGRASRAGAVRCRCRFCASGAAARVRASLRRPVSTGEQLESQIAPSRGLQSRSGSLRIVSDAMRAADLVLLLASGTASLEATLLAVPMVMVYKVAPS